MRDISTPWRAAIVNSCSINVGAHVGIICSDIDLESPNRKKRIILY